MKPIVVGVLAVSIAASGAPALAQNPAQGAPRQQVPAAGGGEIRGAVVDGEGSAPIGSAAVSVWSRADSSLVTGAVVRPDGSFRIEGLRPGSYYLKVSAPGYAARTIEDVAIAGPSGRFSAGNVPLTRSAMVLEGLTVTGERSAGATIAPDRNAYQAKDVAPAAGNASDVLQNVPSVEVDADGKVSLRGNENVVVQINGRPAPLRGAQLAGYLRQLPANLLERVEVVPNPSAKDDPEGMAGIINIVLKQNVDLGLSGGMTLAGSTSDRYVASGNVGYQSGPVTLFTSYGFNSDRRSVVGINDRLRLGAERTPLAFTEQDIAGDETNGGHNLNATLDYRLSRQDVLTNSLLVNRRNATDESLSAYSELNGTRLLLDRYDRTRDSQNDNLLVDYTLAFKRTLEPQRHELSTELRFNRSDEEDRTLLWRLPVGEAGLAAAQATPEAETNVLDALTYQLTAQADYTRMLRERTKLETGYKGNARWLDRGYEVLTDPLGTGDWESSDRSNELELDEQVHAAYGVVSQGAGKFDLQAGLRAEYARRDFSLAGAESYPHSYTSLFPSALVSYKLNDATQAKVSYSRRIRRPGTQELNPFPVFFDPQNVFLGNPELNPEYTDAIELGLQRSWRMGSLQVSPFYRHTSDVIRFIIDTDDVVAGREVTTISFKNLDTSDSWGTDVNGSLRLGPMFSGFAGFNVYKMVTEGGSAESAVSSDAVTWSGRVNGTLNVSKQTALQASYFYRAPMAIEGGRFASMAMTNLSVRHRLPGDKATVSLRVSDPFDTMRFRVEAGDDNLTQVTERKFNSRAVHLTFQYNFGKAPKIRQRPQEQADSSPSFGPQ
ncbi:MAG TPA: TonB-dependent receptor [Longimicrobiaceae bacterium]|nr:TonB-dependent receptor [Longimicrobiaceae bacterium]